MADSKTFHNHLTIDVVKPFLEFDSDKFWELLYEIRLSCLKQFARLDTGLFVFTWCYEHPKDLVFYEKIEKCVLSESSEIIPIFLKCHLDVLKKRIENPSGVEMGKLCSVTGLEKKLREWNCVPIPTENCFTLVTDKNFEAMCVRDYRDFKIGKYREPALGSKCRCTPL